MVTVCNRLTNHALHTAYMSLYNLMCNITHFATISVQWKAFSTSPRGWDVEKLFPRSIPESVGVCSCNKGVM